MYLSPLRKSPERDSSVHYKIAETRDEYEQAFKLLHDTYQREGILEQTPSGMKVTLHALMPTTTVFVALEDDRVVGTLALVEDSDMGLPMEDLYPGEIRVLRQAKRRLAEVGSLAFERRFRHCGVALVLYGLMFRWARHWRGVDDIVITVNPSARDYFTTTLGFVPIGPVRSYPRFVNAPAVALRMNLHEVVPAMRRAHAPRWWSRLNPIATPDYHAFLFGEPMPTMCVPVRDGRETRASLSEDDLRHFLRIHEEDLGSITRVDRVMIKHLWNSHGSRVSYNPGEYRDHDSTPCIEPEERHPGMAEPAGHTRRPSH